MAHIINRTFGKFVRCVDTKTGEMHKDWRQDFYGQTGLIVIGESERKHPGWRFVYFYPSVNGTMQPWFNTPTAAFEETGTGIKLISENSVWTFEFGDFDLSRMDKQELMLNVMAGVVH